MDRRHHLHLRQSGGNLKNGKNDMHGKNDKTGTNGGNGKNDYSFPEPSVTLQDSCTFVDVFRTLRVQTSANVVYGTGCEHRTPRTRATDAHFSRVLAHVTVAHHLPTSHRWLKNELSIRVQPAFSSVVNPWQTSNLGSSWKQEQGNKSCLSVERSLLKGKRDREFGSVSFSQHEQERNLHEYLEKLAERALQGECAAQNRLSEAEVEMNRRSWERRNSDVALCETNQQLESQRLELYHATQ